MSGGNICSIATCQSNSKKPDPEGKKVMFFTFPKDPKISKEWARRCCRKDNWFPKNKRMCSKHFLLTDYEDEMQARLMNLHPKKLKNTAIPTLFLPLVVNKDPSERTQRMIKKQNKEFVKSLLQETDANNDNISMDITEDITDVPSTSNETECDIWKRKFALLEQENEQLKKKVLNHENNEKILKLSISNLEEEIKKSNFEKNSNLEKQIKLALQHVLSPNQVEIALKKKTKARWTQDELSKAFTLRYFSKRSYIYLRQTLHYPLPGISTLQQWASNINLTNGVLEDVLRIMGIAGQTSILKQASLGHIDIPDENMEIEEAEKPILDTDSTTSSSSNHSSLKGESEKDGLAYIAGYLARKHRLKYPHLGQYTYQTEKANALHSYSMPSWIQSLSFGGLTQPSDEWMQQVTLMDKYFQKYHKQEFCERKDVIEKTTEYIATKVTDVPKENSSIHSPGKEYLFVSNF